MKKKFKFVFLSEMYWKMSTFAKAHAKAKHEKEHFVAKI